MNERVVITGGAGFIGCALALELVKKGYVVTIIDNFNTQVHGNENHLPRELFKHIHLIKDSILNDSALKEAFANQDYLIHLAAHTATGQSMYTISEDINTNVLGTSRIMDYLVNQNHQLKKIIIASSRAVYGEGAYCCPNCEKISTAQRNYEDMDNGMFDLFCPNCKSVLIPIPTKECEKLTPLSIYGASKVAVEQIVSMSAKAINLPFTILRYQNVYGVGQSLINPYTGILSTFAMRVMNNKPLYIFEDGQESRDFVYIDDVVHATVAVMSNTATDNKIYNIGTGKRTSIYDVAQTLIQEAGSKSSCIITGNYRIGDIRHNFADISQAFKDFNFFPKIDIQTGIQKFILWFLKQQIPKDSLDISLMELKQKKMLRGDLYGKI